MIPKNLDQVTAADVDALVTGQVREGRTIEYKQMLPGGKDEDKKEFLADVSSFANTVGGDLLYGMAEASGVPTAVTGIATSDVDAELRRLDSIIAAGLDPRIRYVAHLVEHPNGKVLILRIDASWLGPHRVVFKSHDKFYARSSAGKYPLDVAELRDAFLRSSAVGERMRSFRETRLVEIAADRTPVPLKAGARVVLHLIPLESFTTRHQFDVSKYYYGAHAFRPMGAMGWSQRINLEGVVTHSGIDNLAQYYTQLYRGGVIEAVDAYLPNLRQNDRQQLPSRTFEDRIIEFVGVYLGVLRELGAATPVYAFLSLTGASGMWLGVGSPHELFDRYPLDRDMLALPEATFLSFDAPVAATLKPTLDMFWNAFGYDGTPNFDATGTRKPQR